MRPGLRQVFRALRACAACVAAHAVIMQAANAQQAGEDAVRAYPARSVRLIVPFTAGGSADNYARLVAQRLGEAWGQQIVVDNRAGSNGIIGTDLAARSPPDGYTLVMGNIGSLAVNPSLYPQLPYRPLADFAPVTLIASSTFVMLVPLSLPATGLNQFIAAAKAQPGQLNFASTGNGSPGHLAAELLATMAGIKLVHVPYKAHGTMMTDLVAGRLHLLFNGVAPAQAQVRAGKLRALAISGTVRSRVMPDVPTVAESGVPGYAVTGWYGVLAPAGTPRRIVDRLHDDIATLLNKADTQTRFAADGAEATACTPAEFAAFIGNEIGKWSPVVKAARLVAE